MSDRSIVPIDDNAPPPLSPLQDVVISPANIAAEQRVKRAITLSFGQRRKIKRQLARLQRQLKRADYPTWFARYTELNPQIERLAAAWYDLKEQLQAAPADKKLLQQWSDLKAEITPIYQRWQVAKSHLRQLQPLVNRRDKLLAALEDHQIARARLKAEQKLFKAMRKEAGIYERLIIDKWTRLGYAHHYTKGDKAKVDKVQFSEISITLDAIYYKIDASFKTAFNNWKTNLPDGVRITDQLLSEVTLAELSLTCQRQITGVTNINGAWVVVHRLDSYDGLLNYVSYKNVLERYPDQHHHLMPVCVGVGQNRIVQWVNLADYPHWLIGGYTNSGKSNLVNVGICTIITRQSPDDVRLVLIDLKGGLEFSFYENIPHLHGDIVTSIEGVSQALADCEAIMNQRFARFKSIGVKAIEQFHLRRPNEDMPRLLIVFDEVASVSGHGDLSKQIMASMGELARKGRAVGIHLWLCTQRPDVKVIEGQVKNNLAVRLSGRMATTSDSITILGNGMAKELAAIQGRMVMQIGPDPFPIQTPHISQQDIIDALATARSYSAPAPLDVPEYARVVHQVWTVERVIELSIKHLRGNITSKHVHEAGDGLSKGQARQLVEKVWALGRVEFEGKCYEVQTGRSNTRRLVEVVDV